MNARKQPPDVVPDPPDPSIPEIEGTPLPDELTGRASKTDDDLATLFDNESGEHIKDGFRGGSGEEEAGGS
jgi:hypothetical protein